MTPDARHRAEFLAREVRYQMDMGVPRGTPFVEWLADYFMRFAQDELRREASPAALGLKEWQCHCPVGTPILDGVCQICRKVIAGCD